MFTERTAVLQGEARCTHLFMNSNSLRFDDPQPPLRRLSFKDLQGGTLRSTKYSWIGGASQLLSEHGMDVMTGLLKQDRSITGKISPSSGRAFRIVSITEVPSRAG